MELVAEQYKKSEVGLIPTDWDELTFKDICWVNQGLQIPISQRLILPNENSKVYITIQYLNDGKTIEYIDDYVASVCCNKEDILMTRTGNTGIVVSGVEGVFHNNFFKINFDRDKFDKDYLVYYLNQSKTKKIILAKAGISTIPDLNHKDFYSIPIPLPPTKAEQAAIANALSDADALINGLEKLIAKKRNIKQGAMQKLLQPKEGWEVKKLGEVAFVNMGQSPLSEYYNSEGIGLPLVQGNADVENRKTIIRFYTSMITKRGKVGDIIMSVRAPVGEISKATFDCCLGRGVCSISFGNEYLYHYLIYFEKSWAKLSTGSTFDSVNSKQVKELEIPVPKPEEQTAIATILSDMDAEIIALETKLEKYKKVKLGMMQNLLTGKIRLI